MAGLYSRPASKAIAVAAERVLPPTRADVLLNTILSGHHSPRGQARYFTVYAGGQPSELFFWGYSGD